MLTAQSSVRISGDGGTTYINFGVSASGADAWDESRVRQVRQVPGAGLTAVAQEVDLVEGSLTMSFDDNAVSAALFFARSGATFDIDVRPVGDTSGGERFRWSGPGEIDYRCPAGGVRRYRCVFRASESITEDTVP